MEYKINLTQSIQIVIDAIRDTTAKEYLDISEELSLGEILIDADELDVFREKVRTHVKRLGFKIERNRIPNESSLTIGQVANALSISALPGTSTTPDQE